MKLRRILFALLLALLAAGVATPAAYAGGPTSVLMSDPSRQRVAAAYHTDQTYGKLADSVGEGRTGPSAVPAGVAGGGEDVRLTWLIHDVQVWRVDRIHLSSGNGIWVETVVDTSGEGRMSGGSAHWHRPVDEAVLVALLSEAGLLGDSGVVATSSPAAEAQATTVPAPATPVAGVLAAGLAGLVLGVAGTLVGVRVRSRTSADAAPRVTLTG